MSLRSTLALAALALGLAGWTARSAAEEGVLFVRGGRVGVGTDRPGPSLLHLRRADGGGAGWRLETAPPARLPTDWYFEANPVTGAFLMSNLPGGGAQVQVFPSIAGGNPPSTLVVRGGHVGIGLQAPAAKLEVDGEIRQRSRRPHPDHPFTESLEPGAIRRHAEAMHRLGRLPALPAARTEGGHAVIDHGARSQGLVEELEKAHLYIERLEREVAELRRSLSAVERILE